MEENNTGKDPRPKGPRRNRSKGRSKGNPKAAEQGKVPSGANPATSPAGKGAEGGQARARQGILRKNQGEPSKTGRRREGSGQERQRPQASKERGESKETQGGRSGRRGRGNPSQKGNQEKKVQSGRPSSSQRPSHASQSQQGGRESKDRQGKQDLGLSFLQKTPRPRSADRPAWRAPEVGAMELPTMICSRCGKEIEDASAAVQDQGTGTISHFDCIIKHLAATEPLSAGDSVVYIGGGRFGVVHFENPSDPKHFKILKTIQWEEKDKRSEWRKVIADHYSST